MLQICLSADRARSTHPKPSQIWQPLLGQSWFTFSEPLPEHSRVSRYSAATDPIALVTWVVSFLVRFSIFWAVLGQKKLHCGLEQCYFSVVYRTLDEMLNRGPDSLWSLKMSFEKSRWPRCPGQFCQFPSDHHGLLIIPTHWLASSLSPLHL